MSLRLDLSHFTQFVHEPLSTWKAEATVSYRIRDCKTEPTYVQSCGLWMYGNLDILRCSLAFTASLFDGTMPYEEKLRAIEAEAHCITLLGKVLVCGIHNELHQKAATVALRWGAPRIVVMSGGFYYHLGEGLDQEPFPTARLWRYEWNPHSDLAISRREPTKAPTYARENPSVDGLIRSIANETLVGLPLVDRQTSLLI